METRSMIPSHMHDYEFTLPEALIIKFTNDSLYERARIIHDFGIRSSKTSTNGYDNRYFINNQNGQTLLISRRNFHSDNNWTAEYYNIEMQKGKLVDDMFEELYGCPPDQSPFRSYKNSFLWICSTISCRINLQDYIIPRKTIPSSKGYNFAVGLEYSSNPEASRKYNSFGLNMSHFYNTTLESMVHLKDSRFKMIRFEPIRCMLATWDFMAKRVLQNRRHWDHWDISDNIPRSFF